MREESTPRRGIIDVQIGMVTFSSTQVPKRALRSFATRQLGIMKTNKTTERKIATEKKRGKSSERRKMFMDFLEWLCFKFWSTM